MGDFEAEFKDGHRYSLERNAERGKYYKSANGEGIEEILADHTLLIGLRKRRAGHECKDSAKTPSKL